MDSIGDKGYFEVFFVSGLHFRGFQSMNPYGSKNSNWNDPLDHFLVYLINMGTPTNSYKKHWLSWNNDFVLEYPILAPPPIALFGAVILLAVTRFPTYKIHNNLDCDPKNLKYFSPHTRHPGDVLSIKKQFKMLFYHRVMIFWK